MTSEEFDAVNEEMVRELFRINPDTGTAFGAHDPYDGMLPHGGLRRLNDTADLMTTWLRKAEKVAAAGELDEDRMISFQVLQMSEALQRFAIDDYPLGTMSPEGVALPGSSLLTMLTRDYATPERKVEWMSSKIEEIPRYLREFEARFRPGRPVRQWTHMSIESARGFPDFLTVLERHFKDKVSVGAVAGLSKSITRARESVQEHIEWLVNLEEHAVDDFAMGAERLDRLLKIRGFEFTADHVLAFGESSLRVLKAERNEVAAKMAPGKGPEAAVALIRADAPPHFDQAFEEVKREVERAKQFVIDNDIATLDYDATLYVVRTPGFMENEIPSAALEMATPFEERQQGMLMLTNAEGEALGDLYSRASIANLAVHEAYPGHFHQGVISNRRPWMHQLSLMLIKPDTMIPSWETQEGWGMYCEKMMMERGFRATLADHHAMLDYAIWRACRIIYDVKLARGEATLDEMIDMFMRETSSPKNVATGEVMGFSRTPGYGLSYLIGRQMVFDLKADLVRTLGSGFDEKRFHDLLAENGNLPFHLAQRVVRHGFGLEVADA